MDSVLIELEKILDDENNLFVKVRNLEGVDDEKLRDLLYVLKDVERFYANTDLVPKYLVHLILELEPSLLIMIDSYSEPERGKIFMAIDEINTALSRCFFPQQFYK
jgi:hypothetical protein